MRTGNRDGTDEPRWRPAGRLRARPLRAQRTTHVPNAWIDEFERCPRDGEMGIVGYEIPYKFVPPKPLEQIDADLKQCTDRIKRMIEEISA